MIWIFAIPDKREFATRSVMIIKRLLSQEALNRMYLNVLNRRFDETLSELRKIPMKQMDYSFLQTYLSRSCYWGHIESVSHIWYKYVRRYPVLTVDPELLCNIGNLALNENKYFIPEQAYLHYKKFHAKMRGCQDPCEYELLRIKVESFAKGTRNKTKFREKWKVYLQDIDNQLPSFIKIRVRDFPFLTESMAETSKEEVTEMLFRQNRILVHNGCTLTLLLNMFLLQPQHHIADKMEIFQMFSEVSRSLDYNDSFAILFHQCKHDGYRISKLIGYAKELGITKLSPVASRELVEGISESSYDFATSDYEDLLTCEKDLLIFGNEDSKP